jgi:NAD(P)-dependent dehydrogenase (short-subunit alcohol dehydrogenase family)
MTAQRIALITGGARGIGFGIARALSAEGAKIAIFDVLPEEAVAQNIAQLKSGGSEPLYVQGDVTRPEDRTRVLAAVRERFGALHVLINNAGVAPKVRADILEATEESYERVMKINLQGPYFLTQLVARWMIEQKTTDPNYRGCIINISSISATVVSLNRGEYCISKAGVSMATRLWAARLGEFDIPVYEIRPGIVATDMTAGARDKYDRLFAEGIFVQPRWGQPEDVGRAAAALVRGDFSYSTGQVILVDGGFTLQRL